MRDTTERPKGVEEGTLLSTQEETIYEWFTKLLDDCSKSVDGLAHIGMSAGNVDVFCNRDIA